MEPLHHTPEDSHALLAARAEARAKQLEDQLYQSLKDNYSLLDALNAEQAKNEQLAKVIEEQAEELSRLKRDNQWYAANNLKQLKILSEIKSLTYEFPMRVTDETQSPSDIIEDLEKGIAAVGKAFVDHFGKVAPF